MEVKYSPSKLSAFDDCKLKYKYTYIDYLKSDLVTIEAFMGSRVHEALENFYRLVKSGRVESLDWLLKEYTDVWQKNYTADIKIVKDTLTVEDYFNKGKECLTDYYHTYKPFNQTKVVELESLLNFEIADNGNSYNLHGFLDRLDWDNAEQTFEIHDYKTSNKLMTQEEAENSFQLGIYHLAIKDKWPDAQKVKLVWHMLSFNKEIVAYKTDIQLKELQANIVKKIKEIEACQDFPPTKSALCEWCGFQDICPLWKHPKEMAQVPVNKYKKDPGVKLVKTYKELEDKKDNLKLEIKEIEEEQAKVSEAAITFAKKEGISIIDGPEAQLKVETKKELRPPTKAEHPVNWQELRDLLIKEGRYQEVSTVNANMMIYRIRNWPAEVVDKISKLLIDKTTEIVKLIKK